MNTNRLIQVFLIASGFLIGQGSMFLAQTALVATERLDVLAALGIGMGVVSLFQWSADCGGVFLLSKQINDGNARENLWQFVAARIVFSSVFVLILFLFLEAIQLDPISRDIIGVGSLAALVWSFNISGILDSLEKNKYAGPLSGLGWAFSALPAAFLVDSVNYGIYVGLAYVTGLIVTIVIQFLSLKGSDIDLRPCRPTISGTKLQLKKGAFFNGAYIPAQVYGRLIPIIIDKLLDSVSAGIYVYAKNIANVVSQFVLFTRRVEFSDVIKNTKGGALRNWSILASQKLSFMSVFLFLVLTGLANIVVYYVGNQTYIDVAQVAFVLVAIVLFWVMSSSLGQALVALEMTGLYASVVGITTMISAIVIWLSISDYGMYAIYFAETIMFIVQFIVYSLLLNNMAKKRITGHTND